MMILPPIRNLQSAKMVPMTGVIVGGTCVVVGWPRHRRLVDAVAGKAT